MNFKKIGLIVLMMAVLLIAAAGVLRAEDNAEVPVTPCPKKVSVVVDMLKPTIFMEYRYFSAQGQAEIVAVKSPVSGLLSEIMVSEGSLVDADQELAVMNAGMSEEIKKLEAAAAKAKKILTDRQNWKEKSEQAIRNAEKDYQKALDLLNEKKAQAGQIVKAPLAGIVHLVMAPGTETEAGALLMEISNPKRMVFQAPLAGSDLGSLKVGEKFIGMTEGSESQVEANVVAVSDHMVCFGVDNEDNQVKDGDTFTFKKFIAEHADAIVIPSDAIQKDKQGDFVYVAEKKKAKKVYVTLGAVTMDKTMVVKGLDTDVMLVVSGLDCLAEGKKIRIVNREELAREQVEVQVKEKEKPAVKKDKKTAKPEKPAKIVDEAETIGQARQNRYMIGLTFERFTINDKNFRDFYSNRFKHIPGLEFSYQAVDKIDVWAAARLYTDKQTTEFYEDTVSFTLIPFSLGARFRPVKMGSFEPFVGAGFNVYYYGESISGSSGLENTSGLAFGLHFQGGSYFYFGPSFLRSIFQKHNRSLLGEIFVKYNIISKTLSELLPDGTDKFDLGGIEIGLGIVVKF